MNKELSLAEILKKLDEAYNKEERLIIEIGILHKQLDQLREDKELLKELYMYQSNRRNRFSNKQY